MKIYTYLSTHKLCNILWNSFLFYNSGSISFIQKSVAIYTINRIFEIIKKRNDKNKETKQLMIQIQKEIEKIEQKEKIQKVLFS